LLLDGEKVLDAANAAGIAVVADGSTRSRSGKIYFLGEKGQK
jgi:hypothetical protein